MLKTHTRTETPTKLNGLAAVVLCSTLLGGCASTAIQDETKQPQQVAAVCESGCQDEDGVSRYQYYLGILSVFLLN